MKNKIVSLIICAAILGGLLGVYYYKSQGDANATPTPTPNSNVTSFVDKTTSDVKGITVTSNGEDIVLEKDEEGTWKAVGKTVDLDKTPITGFLNSYVGLYASETLSDIKPDQYGEYGLNPPVFTVSGRYSDNGEESFSFGESTASGEYCYMIRPGDDNVYLVRSSSVTNLNLSYDGLVNKAMIVLAPEMITYGYIYRAGKPDIEMGSQVITPSQMKEIQNNGFAPAMIMASPVSGKEIYVESLDNAVIKSLGEVKLGPLVDVDSSDLSKYGLDEPKYHIILEQYQPSTEEDQTGVIEKYDLLVGKDRDETTSYAMYGGSPHVFAVDNGSLAFLDGVNPFKFIDKFVSLVNISTVESVEIQGLGKEYEMVLNHTFTPVENSIPTDELAPVVNGQSVQEKAFKTYYQVLLGILYENTVEPYQAQGTPVFTVTYNLLEGGKQVDSYYAYDSNFYAVAKDDGIVNYVVSKQYAEQIFKYAEDLLAGKLDK